MADETTETQTSSSSGWLAWGLGLVAAAGIVAHLLGVRYSFGWHPPAAPPSATTSQASEAKAPQEPVELKASAGPMSEVPSVETQASEPTPRGAASNPGSAGTEDVAQTQPAMVAEAETPELAPASPPTEHTEPSTPLDLTGPQVMPAPDAKTQAAAAIQGPIASNGSPDRQSTADTPEAESLSSVPEQEDPEDVVQQAPARASEDLTMPIPAPKASSDAQSASQQEEGPKEAAQRAPVSVNEPVPMAEHRRPTPTNEDDLAFSRSTPSSQESATSKLPGSEAAGRLDAAENREANPQEQVYPETPGIDVASKPVQPNRFYGYPNQPQPPRFPMAPFVPGYGTWATYSYPSPYWYARGWLPPVYYQTYPYSGFPGAADKR